MMSMNDSVHSSRVIREDFRDGSCTICEYDAASYLTKESYFDAEGRLFQRIEHKLLPEKGAEVTKTFSDEVLTHFVYNITQEIFDGDTVKYEGERLPFDQWLVSEYDRSGRLLKKNRLDENGIPFKIFIYEYDGAHMTRSFSYLLENYTLFDAENPDKKESFDYDQDKVPTCW